MAIGNITMDFNSVDDCNAAANRLHTQLSYSWRFNDQCIVLYEENLGENLKTAFEICRMYGGKER